MSDLSQPSLPLPDASARAIAYHERTKHSLERYARGPETLDWSAQPNPFREFSGCRRRLLPLSADQLDTPYAVLGDAGASIAARPLNVESISTLLEISFGLSAWKSWGPDRWAVRCNPSSGNLHPTEVYLVSNGVEGLADGVHHYLPDRHGLEVRCNFKASPLPAAGIWIALSSIVWREAWKYGERAFRYCQLDAGHALSALRHAAAALGWRVETVDSNSDEIATLAGLAREPDFAGVEPEEPELLLRVLPVQAVADDPAPALAALLAAVDQGSWHGKAALLDPYPMYHWPLLDDVALATRRMDAAATVAVPPPMPVPLRPTSSLTASALFRQRRSAQQFDRKSQLPVADFMRLLEATQPDHSLLHAPHLHLLLFVHRVAGLPAGLYLLPRSVEGEHALRKEMHGDFAWQRVDEAPATLPLYRLADGAVERHARQICCHQAIAADSAFVVAMLAEFEEPVSASASHYRSLHREAGELGHVLYLEAEALGQRGTGIGCYFDDSLHGLLGLRTQYFQSLYHFTVGMPLADSRIASHPPYADRQGETS